MQGARVTVVPQRAREPVETLTQKMGSFGHVEQMIIVLCA